MVVPPVYEVHKLIDYEMLPHRVKAVACNTHRNRMGAPNDIEIFAVACETRVYCFEVPSGKVPRVEFEVFIDNNIFYSDQFNDEFGVVEWGCIHERRDPYYILVAGSLGIIRVINARNFSLLKSLKGHTHRVTDIKTERNEASLFCSASEESIRLWCIRTGVCTHRVDLYAELQPVPPPSSLDFYVRNRFCILSCGEETGVRLWYLQGKAWKDGWLFKKRKTQKLDAYGATPQLLTVDSNVDFIRCLDRTILTRMPPDELVLFNYLGYGEDGNRDHIRSFPIVSSSKFENNFHFTLAVGNNDGHIVIWNFSRPKNPRKIAMLTDGDDLPITHTAISNDECTKVSINNDGRVIVWKRAT
ncbi:unnamed protein product [Arabis nemorensis]|uniref:Uncharacterized protein n=1 Tax=Arabis nemorensis TaxID=586526 RepID=A0A565BUS7_9BRAS|nr:unnamed protein product [Arabis nemorensis]